MSHTPGPWGFERSNDYFEIAPVRNGELDWSQEVAATAGCGGDIGEQEANARLIAAAPELWDAAKALYLAGRWDCALLPAGVAADMWARLRDALGIPEGTATKLGIAASIVEKCQAAGDYRLGDAQWEGKFAEMQAQLEKAKRVIMTMEPLVREYVQGRPEVADEAAAFLRKGGLGDVSWKNLGGSAAPHE